MLLHPRRHNVGFLSGLLRATVAPAALMVFMLAANVQGAHADTVCSFSFGEVTGAANPLDGVDVGIYSAPAFVDVDGDGDSDAFIGERDGNIKYYENTGTALVPAFTEVTGVANPFNGVDVGGFSSPAFVDVDGDGDSDAFIGEFNGTLHYFENTGTALTPAFAERTGTANSFNGVDVGDRSKPAFVDVDGDGDSDAFVGEDFGTVKYYENTGTALVPVFVERTGGANPFNGVDVGYRNAPAFVDVDGDGDSDAFVGERYGTLKYYENTGTPLAPVYTEQTGGANPLNGVDVGYLSAPAFVDVDGDGDSDAFIGELDGDINYFENTSITAQAAFGEVTGAANPFSGVDVGGFSAPAFVDVDGDGDRDAFIGEYYGTLKYFENTGTALAPVFVERTSGANPFDGVDVGYYSTPAFVDVDGDGDSDAFIGEFNGTLHYFENTGTTLVPVFTERIGVANPFNGVDVGSRNVPAFADVDGDGDSDAFIGEWYGTIKYFENTGTALAPVFTERIGGANPFNGVNVGYHSKPAFVDVDGDGDSDAFIGEYDGNIYYFENTGTALAPIFAERTGAANPFDGVDVGVRSAPAFVDVDGDGDTDAFIGELDGTIKYYENIPDCPPTTHSADQDGNNVISLLELLRVIQYFNVGSFHCDVVGVDGFNPGTGDTSCTPHSSDYNPQNWSIELLELLRIIQYFNVGGYFSCPGVGEDGFCPGTP